MVDDTTTKVNELLRRHRSEREREKERNRIFCEQKPEGANLTECLQIMKNGFKKCYRQITDIMAP